MGLYLRAKLVLISFRQGVMRGNFIPQPLPSSPQNEPLKSKPRLGLIVFGDMIADMESHKNLSPIVTELFVTGKKVFQFHSNLNIIRKCLNICG